MMPDKLFIIGSLAADNMSHLQATYEPELLLTDSKLHLEPTCILLLIIMGKCIMNLFIFGVRKPNVSASFLGYFCISLAAVDMAHLFVIFAIQYFQDFSVLGFRVTSYYICLFTQIISHTYGILHLPVFLASGLDYYLKIVKSINGPRICLELLYSIFVVLLWIAAFTYVLQSPVHSSNVYKDSAYFCIFYISDQCFYLSAVLIFITCLVLAVSACEIVSLVKSLKAISYAKNTILVFSFEDKWAIQGRKHLLAAVVFSFLSIWGPFALLQIIILAIYAPIPAYMDMNVPWLYFMNSFLIAAALGLKYPDLQVTEKTLSTDPFISWKCCVLSFTYTYLSKEASLDELLSDVVAI